ncbi:MAG: eukaryotic-like serine/threonine-protein kinase [Verrucomicrobiota bacterium]
MEQKIFLGKYRVARDEMAQVGAEPASVTMAAATEQLTTARIYRGDDMDSGRDVTIEVVPVGAFKPSVRTKLEEEAIAAKQINHINIPALYDFGIEDDQLVYVTEYFDGTSAEDWVNQHGPMPTGAVLRIALQVMSAMGAAGSTDNICASKRRTRFGIPCSLSTASPIVVGCMASGPFGAISGGAPVSRNHMVAPSE